MTQEIRLPDIGDVDSAEVIEINVSVGDKIKKEDPLLVLESDKASMDIPSSVAGEIKELKVSVGDKLSKGDLIAMIEPSSEKSDDDEEAIEEVAGMANDSKQAEGSQSQAEGSDQKQGSDAKADSDKKEKSSQSNDQTERTMELTVPDLGDIDSAEIIEINVSSGDKVEKEASLIVLETDKATMDLPSPEQGEIVSISVSVGDTICKGDVFGEIKAKSSQSESSDSEAEETTSSSQQQADQDAADQESSGSQKSPDASDNKEPPVPDLPIAASGRSSGKVHASPAVRRFARELGADLTKIEGSGRKKRILKDDVQKFVKYELSRPKATATSGSFASQQMPKVDHSKWGEVESVPLTRIQKISSVNLHRNWVTIPHVTQHEEADITELEKFRKSMKSDAEKQGIRLTPLAFVLKAVVASLKAFPTFNASLADDGEHLVMKKYFHIGVAVDTPKGLVVPVVRDVDQKSVYQLAQDLAELSAKAREGKLGADSMQGGCFTISSLGGIGGTAFTPIVNWPDVAILGLSKNQMKPVWNGSEFVPRLMLPMSLSYDHRVIDGAVAARFAVDLANNLADIRRLLL